LQEVLTSKFARGKATTEKKRTIINGVFHIVARAAFLRFERNSTDIPGKKIKHYYEWVEKYYIPSL